MKYQESHLSAHHNYLVNGMLAQGFSVGDSGSRNGFFLLADIVPFSETAPRISARLMDEEARLLVELEANRIRENPGKGSIEHSLDGYRIVNFSGEVLMEVRTRAFANGYLTLLRARLFDEHGHLKVEPCDESICVYGGNYLSRGSNPKSEVIQGRLRQGKNFLHRFRGRLPVRDVSCLR